MDIVLAAENKKFYLVESLLHDLPSIDATDRFGRNVLYLAAIVNDPELARMALAHGANLELRNRRDILQYAAFRTNSSQLLEVLLSNGADPNAQGTDGMTAIQVAAHFGNIGAMRRLLAYGADPLRRSKNGWTLLHYIVQGANHPSTFANIKPMMALVESYGISRSTRNAKGQTAAEMAYEQGVTAKSKGQALVARRLFEAAVLLKEKAP